jgi:hypothetical protein
MKKNVKCMESKQTIDGHKCSKSAQDLDKSINEKIIDGHKCSNSCSKQIIASTRRIYDLFFQKPSRVLNIVDKMIHQHFPSIITLCSLASRNSGWQVIH